MSAATVPASAAAAISPRQKRYALPARHASRKRPVAAQVASGTTERIPSTEAMNRSA